MKRGDIRTHEIMDDRKNLPAKYHSSEKSEEKKMVHERSGNNKSSIKTRATSNHPHMGKNIFRKCRTTSKQISHILIYLKRLYTTVKPKIAHFLEKPWIKGIVGALFTLLIIPQLLNAYNVHKSEDAALQSTIQQIYINYEAGNYSEVEQDIYYVYPKLQKKKDYQTLLDLSDLLLFTTYQKFYRNHEQLSSGQKDIINLYANNALGYAEKLKDTTSYIKICIHTALFNISEYEFTLDTNYLDKADIALSVAGKYFDKTHDSFLTITDKSEAELACQFFNLKNLQHQVSYYRALIAYSFDNSTQTSISSTNTEQINPYDNLCLTTCNFIANVHIIEDQNADLGLIPEDEIQHMKICAGVAYIKSGNLLFDFGGMQPIILTNDNASMLGYYYSAVDICSNLFSTMEGAAINIKNYEDLVNVYKSAETYYYLNYIAGGNNDVLIKYNEYVDKLLEMDPSGDGLAPYLIEAGNGAILDEYIEKTEGKLSNMTLGEDPFSFSMMKYLLGTQYKDRASFREESGDITNAKLDYENANRCFSSALLYFTQEQKGIFENIQRLQVVINERLSALNK